jgi:hypothetical protein
VAGAAGCGWHPTAVLGGPRRAGRWPIELPRTVVLHVAQMAVGVGVCERGGLLAVLPTVWAERTPETLWRLPVDVVAEKTVFALVRSSIYQPGPAEWVLERLLEVRRPPAE